MEYDNADYLDFETWYHLNKSHFPSEFKAFIEDSYEPFYFLFNVYRKVMAKMVPSLRQLMGTQYPVFNTEKRPTVLEFISTIATTTGFSLLFRLYNLVQDQKKGVNLRVKYPKFESWIDLYARPQQPATVDEKNRPVFSWLNEEEWKVYVETENNKMFEFFNWEERRKFDFIDLVQSIILKYFKELEELNGDEWIIYAVTMRQEYKYFMTSCENVELFIDCGFREDEIKLTDDEFIETYSKLSKEIVMKASALRDRRISGEII